jgi:predicted 3-demethylubiquinone-9 3-methyltransferase (glyoxalase superfamily)
MQKITTFLWFDSQAEEAATFYTSLFAGSKINSIARYGAGGPGEPGSVMTVDFELFGQQFVALNGGPIYNFTPAISLYVHCQDQAEIDKYWRALTAGGREDQCGWLVDKYGVSWQIVPDRLIELLQDPDAAKAQRVMGAMLQMQKIDLPTIEAAAKG